MAQSNQSLPALKITMLDVTGIQAKIERLGKKSDKLLQAVALGVGQEVANFLKTYPLSSPSVRGARHHNWVTHKQRRYFFWALSKGYLNFPYRRRKSGGLGGGWNVQLYGTSGAVVGQRMPYGIWVQSWKFQVKMHADTGWRTDKMAVEWASVNNVVSRQFNKVFDRWMS